MSESSAIVQKLWNYCNVLRDEGISYGYYVEQLTYLLFLKMADEQTEHLGEEHKIPEGLDWDSLVALEGSELEAHYRNILEELGKEQGIIGEIFRKAENRIRDPAKLKRLISLIDEEVWMGLPIDIKAEIYEGLLQKNAEDVKSGAGQYFTPRPLIKAMVECIAPEPNKTVIDPACGTGGFFLATQRYLLDSYPNMSRDEKEHLRKQAFRGWEIVQETARLCLMNMYLHGITGDIEEESPITVADSLEKTPSNHYDYVLTNPPFGRKSSITIFNGDGQVTRQTLSYERDDFWATTSNKQLNFLQHVRSLLKQDGKAAIVVPDNVLFEGGAGETIRRKMLQQTNCHTLLRLPTGVFYAQGVKANVLFFDRKPASLKPWTEKFWIYDLRTNMHFTLKQNPLTYNDLEDFVKCYNPSDITERTETERFKAYTYEELIQRDKANLDITWIKDESLEETENLPPPEILAEEIIENLRSALEEFEALQEELEK
ncbi:MAG: type I restriction-modification system subunit M [Candidatus Hodarchaeales archaeon]